MPILGEGIEGKEEWKKCPPSLPSHSSFLPLFPPIQSIQKTNFNIEVS